MFRNILFVAGALIVLAPGAVYAQSTTSNPTPSALSAPGTQGTPSRLKFSRERLKQLRAHWRQNKGKLSVCRKEARSKGLIEDERWFFIEDCMSKS